MGNELNYFSKYKSKHKCSLSILAVREMSTSNIKFQNILKSKNFCNLKCYVPRYISYGTLNLHCDHST